MSRSEIAVLAGGIILALFILEMVRRRRLREEYSWLWLLTAATYLVLALFRDLSDWIARVIGAVSPVSTYTFFGFFFLLLICVQFSVQISRLTEQNKNLSQQLAILDGELNARGSEERHENLEGKEVETPDAQRPDHRPGGLVPGTDQHQPASELLAGL